MDGERLAVVGGSSKDGGRDGRADDREENGGHDEGVIRSESSRLHASAIQR